MSIAVTEKHLDSAERPHKVAMTQPTHAHSVLSALLTVFGMLLACCTLWAWRDFFLLSDVSALALMSGLVVGSISLTVYQDPEPFLRFLLLRITKLLFRVKIIGSENIPSLGGALIAANHVSFADAFLLSCITARPIRFLMFRPYYEIPVLKQLFRTLRAIAISNGRPSKAALRALQEAAAHMAQGDLVGIFPEGRRTRTGMIEEFQRGIERIGGSAPGTPIIPVYLHGLWGVPSSFKAEKSLWDYILFQRRVTIVVGSPVEKHATAPTIHHHLCRLRTEALGLN